MLKQAGSQICGPIKVIVYPQPQLIITNLYLIATDRPAWYALFVNNEKPRKTRSNVTGINEDKTAASLPRLLWLKNTVFFLLTEELLQRRKLRRNNTPCNFAGT